MNKVGLTANKCNELLDFIVSHHTMDFNSIKLYEKYPDSEFLKFSWTLDAIKEEQLVILTYVIAKWVDQQIKASDLEIKNKYNLLFAQELSDILNTEILDIDINFINLMLDSDKNSFDLENRLLRVVE